MNENVLESDAVLKSFVENVVPVIKRDLAASQVLIFGSRVKGEATKESDVDVIIVSDFFRGIKFVKRMAAVLRLIRFSRHVDFICYTPEEFERIKDASIVVKTAVSEGVIA